MELLYWIAGLAAVAALDRALLAMEARGWINYRRRGLSRGAALYHTFELQSIFDPSIRPVIEIRYGERKQEDESGAPPGGIPDAPDDRSADAGLQDPPALRVREP
jgi:hypothetical protein